MEEEKWIRECPRCKKEMQYGGKYSLDRANRLNSNCSSCATSIRPSANPRGKGSPYKLETWIAKGFSQEEAERKVRESRPLNKEYWIAKGFNQEEAERKVREYQNKNTQKLWEKYRNGSTEYVPNTSIEYYLRKGMTLEEASGALKERQATFSLEKCVKRYGEEMGRKRWQDRQDKWKKKIFDEYGSISTSCSILQKKIAEYLIVNGFDEILYSTTEKFIHGKFNGRNYPFKYDICEPNLKRIIEFNGDFWHMNPDYYDSEFVHPVTKMKAKDKWEFDRVKIEAAESHGYQVLVIWESEMKNNEHKILERCLSFMK